MNECSIETWHIGSLELRRFYDENSAAFMMMRMCEKIPFAVAMVAVIAGCKTHGWCTLRQFASVASATQSRMRLRLWHGDTLSGERKTGRLLMATSLAYELVYLAPNGRKRPSNEVIVEPLAGHWWIG